MNALVITSGVPDEVSGHGIALKCSLDAYEHFFERVEYINILGDAGNKLPPSRFPRTRFTTLGVHQASQAVRFSRSIFKHHPALVTDLVGQEALGRLTEEVHAARVRCDPQVVIFETLAVAATLIRLRELFSPFTTVLRSMDVVYRGFVEVAEDIAFPLNLAWSHELTRMRQLEAEVLDIVNVIWAITETDAEHFLTDFGIACHGVLGVYLNAERFCSVAPGDPATIVHVGAVDTRKKHGLRIFTGEGWPLVRKAIPTAKLILAGRGSEGFHCPEAGVSALGFVENDVDVLGRGAVFLNSQVSGSGIKVKNMNAMASRRLLVSTPNGVQGMPGTIGRDFLVGANTQELATVLIWALREPQLANRIAENGYRLVHQAFAKSAFLETSVNLFRRSFCPTHEECPR